MTFPIDNSNKLYKRVDDQLNELSRDGLYLESKAADLANISFAFPDITNGVANFTIEEASNRKNCAFVAFAFDRSNNDLVYLAKCQFYDSEYEIVACTVEPKRYYIYNNGELIAYFDAETDSFFPFCANGKKEYPVYVDDQLFGNICIDSAISLNSKITFETAKYKFKLPIYSQSYIRTEFQEWWEIISLRWLDFGVKSNKDLIIRNKKFKKLSKKEQSVLFVLALICRSYFVWEANENDYYLK